MAFKFVPVTTIKRVIKVEIPGDFGKTTPADFEAEFKRLSVSEARALVEKIRAKEVSEDQVLRENVVNIKGVQGEDGHEIEFSQDLLTNLIEQAYIRGPLLAGLMDVNFSLDKLKQKNS
ncbi:hypothetical protein FIU82_06105 [Pseudoalteromonas sp. THAF3]|uniref:hypothetical protein n=1 Tax=Pseudoalteromonas sp. THAF3 TaxID=2587843 RepID=UPI00126916BB|nr:hypothetical protein [Pseudoalteromonas sp. THAF3]QFU04589.1 hypothetical protein FIU82_06105 [Pseudoalteromonas sp. THAF3]